MSPAVLALYADAAVLAAIDIEQAAGRRQRHFAQLVEADAVVVRSSCYSSKTLCTLSLTSALPAFAAFPAKQEAGRKDRESEARAALIKRDIIALSFIAKILRNVVFITKIRFSKTINTTPKDFVTGKSS